MVLSLLTTGNSHSRWVSGTTSARWPPSHRKPGTAGSRVARESGNSKLTFLIALLVLVAAGLWVYDTQVDPQPPQSDAAARAESGSSLPAASTIDFRAIAVLPFQNASADPEQDFLADGFAEDLLIMLAHAEGVKVASRNSAFQFRDDDTDIGEVAETLDVSHVLRGSVQLSGEELVVSVQLIQANDGARLWSGDFNEPRGQIFEIQDDIVSAVVAALGVELPGDPPRAEVVNPGAYLLWLKGRYFYAEWDRENFERAVDAYQAALRIDPEFVEAWASLSVTYLSQTQSGYREIALGLAQARFAIEKALEFDPDRPSVLARLANIQTKFEWDWAGAEETVSKALKIAPMDERVLGAAANLANSLGHGEEALRYREQALSLDPLNLLSLYNVAEALHRVGRLGKAREAYRALLELDPQDWGTRTQLAIILLQQGEPEAAWRELELEVDPQQQEYGRILVLPALGREDEAAARLNSFIEEHQSWGAYLIASIYAMHGDPDSAFLWLDHALQVRAATLSQVLLEPTLTSLHSDPRWSELLDNMGLPH